MPRVTGPLHSEEARGQLGKQLIFQQRGSRSYVKKYAVPTGTATQPQLVVRATTKQIMQRWATLQPPAKRTWLGLAIARGIEPINAYTQENFARIRRGESITDTWPPTKANNQTRPYSFFPAWPLIPNAPTT